LLDHLFASLTIWPYVAQMPGQGQSVVSLTLQDVACARGGRLLFEGLTLSLGSGDAARVTGPNGVGKSSLLRLIAGLLMAERGTIVAEGRIALADERPALDPEKPLGRALGFWAGIDGADVSSGLAAMGLKDLIEVPVRMLSTGQLRRASLARVMAAGADIWLLDEPANGLDADSLILLQSAIAAHRAKGGIVVIASHQSLDLTDATTVAL
jgi:heme exporter protein A